ncbi:hypothetical protein L6452_32362 [Arctium lappa]|uniref:Uncharacterized protein n=1 Tax=Arctium lappa TaxID=4217 RepID=A0ACB8Z8N8_ARCLA|nr:hypothetical protein L6452_32362 [Arctium lappa]
MHIYDSCGESVELRGGRAAVLLYPFSLFVIHLLAVFFCLFKFPLTASFLGTNKVFDSCLQGRKNHKENFEKVSLINTCRRSK